MLIDLQERDDDLETLEDDLKVIDSILVSDIYLFLSVYNF